MHQSDNKSDWHLYNISTNFLLHTRVKNSCPFPGSHNRTATNPFSNHVNASMSSGCTQGTKYVLFGQPPYRSAHTTTRHSAGAPFKTINIYSTIFKSLIKYPNKPWSNDVHACSINVNQQSSITVWVLILVLQSKSVCLSKQWGTDRLGLQNKGPDQQRVSQTANHADGEETWRIRNRRKTPAFTKVLSNAWPLRWAYHHHSVFCLTTGPKPPPKRCLHIVWSRASSFKWE